MRLVTWLGALTLIVGVAACSNDDGGASSEPSAAPDGPATSISSSTTAPPSAASFGTAVDVIAGINSGGLACAEDSVDNNQPGGGAASVEFCDAGGHRVQVVTFADDSGKELWLGLADDIAAGFAGQEYVCVVGVNFAACPDPGPGSNDLGAQIAAAVGGEVRQTGA